MHAHTTSACTQVPQPKPSDVERDRHKSQDIVLRWKGESLPPATCKKLLWYQLTKNSLLCKPGKLLQEVRRPSEQLSQLVKSTLKSEHLTGPLRV